MQNYENYSTWAKKVKIAQCNNLDQKHIVGPGSCSYGRESRSRQRDRHPTGCAHLYKYAMWLFSRLHCGADDRSAHCIFSKPKTPPSKEKFSTVSSG